MNGVEWGMKRSLFAVALAAVASRAVLFAAHTQLGLQQVLAGPFYFVPWGDYQGIYVAQLSYLARGVVPYAGFGYSYPPLFLYSMLPFYIAGGPDFPAVLILAADALTAVVILGIVARRSTTFQGLLAGTAYALLPLALGNEGYLWLSSQPMLFFMVLSVYFFDRKRIVLSMLALGTAVMFKQEIIFVALPMLYFAFKGGFRTGLKGLGTLIVVLGAVSLPFLLATPSFYVNEISFGLIGVTGSSTIQPVSPWLGLTFTGGASACPGTCGFVPNPGQIGWDHFMNGLDTVLGWTILPLLALSAVALYAMKRSRGVVYLSMAELLVAFLYLFLLKEHFAFAYYMLPVYALLICAASDKKSLAVPIIGSTLATFISYGNMQLVISIVSVLAATALAEVRLVGNKLSSNQTGGVPDLDSNMPLKALRVVPRRETRDGGKR